MKEDGEKDDSSSVKETFNEKKKLQKIEVGSQSQKKQRKQN